MGRLGRGRFVLHFNDGIADFSLFHDGRMIVRQVSDEEGARSVYSRYVESAVQQNTARHYRGKLQWEGNLDEMRSGL